MAEDEEMERSGPYPGSLLLGPLFVTHPEKALRDLMFIQEGDVLTYLPQCEKSPKTGTKPGASTLLILILSYIYVNHDHIGIT